MTLFFTNINKFFKLFFYVFLIKILLYSNVFAAKDRFYLPDKTGYLYWKCDMNNMCNIFLKKKSKEVVILRDVPTPLIQTWNNDLISLFFSCGSPCNYSFFYSSKIGLSKSFEFAVAVDIKNLVVVIAENNYLIGYKIFNATPPLFCIKKDWSPTAALINSIVEAKFINDKLFIKYLKGKNFLEESEIIDNLPRFRCGTK